MGWPGWNDNDWEYFVLIFCGMMMTVCGCFGPSHVFDIGWVINASYPLASSGFLLSSLRLGFFELVDYETLVLYDKGLSRYCKSFFSKPKKFHIAVV